METYCDLIVIRTGLKNSLVELQNKIKVPIINAGDGDGEHPTQSFVRCFYY